MSELIITERSNIVSIADAIRGKANITRNLTFDEMANSINSISSSGGIDTSDATATAEDIYNGKTAYVDGVKIVGTHECEVGTDTSDATITSGSQMLSGVTAYGANGKITGTIPSQGASTIVPTELEQIAISSGTYASGDIKVAAIATETKELTSNGTHTPSAGKYFSSVTVNVPSEDFITQSKTVAPSMEQQIVVPDSGYDGLESVTVNAMSSGDMNDIEINMSGLITASVGTSGYLEAGASKTLQLDTQAGSIITPTDSDQTIVDAGTYVTGDISIVAVPTETKDITENGTYIPQDGKYFSSVSVNIPSETFETQSKTIVPNESQQVVTPDNGYDGLSSVTIEDIPSDYVGSSIVREGAKVITPTKTEQTVVEAGTYVNGDITVNAIPNEYIVTTDADAIASDLAEGKTAYVNGEKITGTHVCSGGGTDTSDATATEADIISGKTAYINGGKVTGTLAVQAYYTGNVEPDDSLGNDGDLYFVRGE